MVGSRLSPPRSPGRSAAKPPGGGLKSKHDAWLETFTSPLAGEVGGKAAGWGLKSKHDAWLETFTSPLAGEVGGKAAGWGPEIKAQCLARDFHLPARRGGRRQSRRVGA